MGILTGEPDDSHELETGRWHALHTARIWAQDHVIPVALGVAVAVVTPLVVYERIHTKPAKAPQQANVSLKGTAPAPPPAHAVVVAPEDSYLLVKWGNTLSGLAVRILGTTDYHQWYRFNPGLPEDPRKLPAGGWLLVPAKYVAHIPEGSTVVSKCFVDARCGSCNSTATASATARPVAPPKTAPAVYAHLDLLRTPIDTESTPIDVMLAEYALADFAVTPVAVITTSHPAAPAETQAASPAPRLIPASYQKPGVARSAKGYPGYAILVSPEMGAINARPKQSLQTLLVERTNGKISQTWLKDSKILVQDKQYVLYVPIPRIPVHPYMLSIGGFERPIPGAMFTENAHPVTRHFPGSHSAWRTIFMGGSAVGVGVRMALFGAAPVIAGAAAGATLIAQVAMHHHQTKVNNEYKAAEGQLMEAQFKLASDDGNPGTHQGRAP